jgi:hypothetical protein
MNRPYGTTIFCDDIRDEISGKKTYVGVYMGNMILSGGFPAVVPQFGLAVTYLEPIGREVKPVVLKVFVPGDNEEEQAVALEIDLPLDRHDIFKDRVFDPLAEYFASILHFRISPFVIPKTGYVKVRAYEGDQEFRLGSLQIRSPLDDEKLEHLV